MNRIRNINNKYEVLINNNYSTNPSIEISLGEIFNTQLKNYDIKIFDNLQDALNLAYDYPPLNFNKMHSDCVDNFKKLNYLLNNILINNNVIIKSKLLLPNEIKNTLFNRILQKGKRFTFYYDFNDIISFDIINPYNDNLLNVINILKRFKELRIINIIKNLTHIKIIGLTDNNITYEIRLWTSILFNFMIWIKNNNKNLLDYMDELYNKINEQNLLDIQHLSE